MKSAGKSTAGQIRALLQGGLCIGLSLLLSGTVCFGEEDSRSVWTNREGKRIEAEYAGYDARKGQVSLKLRNGKKVMLKAELLSGEDMEWVRKREEGNALPSPASLVEGRLGKVSSLPAADGYPSSHVYYPSNLDLKNPPPVIFLFSPVGNGHSLASKFAKACEARGWVAVGFGEFRNHNGELREVQKTMWTAILKNMERLYFYDPDRMYLGGMSGGSVTAFNKSACTGDEARYWKGVVAMCGWLGGMKSVNCPTKMAVMFVDNYKTDTPPKEGEDFYLHKSEEKILKKRGSKVGYKSFKGGHELPPDELLIPVLEWMEENSVKSSQQQFPVETLVKGEKLKKGK